MLDFSQYLSGPSAALRLADFGARVIKVERPDGGDAARALHLAGQTFGDDSALFHVINRNKDSVAIDLKDPANTDLLKRLIAAADVVIHNFRPGIMQRLGLGYVEVSAINPRIIYAGVSGYGVQGPWRDRPGQDLLVQSVSGLAWLSGASDGPPVPIGLSLIDIASGMHLVQGILALLVRRARTQRGGQIDVSLLESAIDLQFEGLSAFLNGSGPPRRSNSGGANGFLDAPYGVFATIDGYLAISMAPRDRLCSLLDDPALSAVPPSRWRDAPDEVRRAIGAAIEHHRTDAVFALLNDAGIWCAPVLDWQRLVESDAFTAVDMVQEIEGPGGTMRTTRCPIRIDGAIIRARRAAPSAGENTERVREEFA